MIEATLTAPHDTALPFIACEAFDLDYFESAGIRFVSEVDLPISKERLFAIFEDEASWTRWPLGISNVEWTSARPFGVGTTRTVTFANGMNVYERFIAWEPGSKMAFHLYGASDEVWTRFGELYEVEATGEGSCKLRWTVAYEPTGVFGKIHFLVKPTMGLGLRFFVKRLAKYCAKVGETGPLG